MTTRPTIIPWLEVNVASEQALDNARAGLEHWQRVCDYAIITTRPGNQANVYRAPQLDLPDIKILPGLKGSEMFGTSPSELDDWRIWHEFSIHAADCLQLTGADVFVWEFEGAVRAYSEGLATVNIDAMATAAACTLPACTHVLYPTILAATHEPTRHRQVVMTDALARAMGPGAILTDWLYNRPAAIGYRDSDRVRAWLDAIQTGYGQQPRWHMVYTWSSDDPEHKYWLYGDDAPYEKDWLRALDLIAEEDPGSTAVVYPHIHDWANAAQVMADVLAGAS